MKVKSPLQKYSKSPVSVTKREIQKVLREIVMKRDLGCIFRFYPEAGQCGGYRNDGELILQFDHLNSRAHSISFADSRLGICVCIRHHIFWKKQEPDLYMKLARKHIGKERAKLLDRVQADRKPKQGINWNLELAALRQELKK